MNLQSFKLGCESVLLLTVALCAVYAVRDLHQTQEQTRSVLASVKNASNKVSSTLDDINAPCTGFHGSVTCGPIAQLSQTEKNMGILAGQATEQIKQSAKLVDATARNLDTVGDSVKQVSDSLKKTSDTAAITLSQATTDLKTANDSIAQVGPLVGHLNALAQSPDVTGTIRHINAISGNFQDVSGDARKVADDATRRFMKPTPWYRKIVPYATAGAKIASYALPW